MSGLKICLIGSAPSSIRLAPYGNPEWTFWGCSPGVYGVAPRMDAWWELHRYEPGQPWFSPEYCQWLAKFKGKVWMAEKRPEIPNSEAIPSEALVERYGPYFFTSSIAYMFAMAMEAGAEKIALYGVDMAATEEWNQQRPALQYFAMLARARGIEVGVPPESDLLRPPPLYGISELSHARIKMLARRRELESRISQASVARDQAQQEIIFLQGALDDLKWVENTWTGEGIERRYVEPPMTTALQQINPTPALLLPETKPKRRYTRRVKPNGEDRDIPVQGPPSPGPG